MATKECGVKKCDDECGMLLKQKVQVNRDRHIRHIRHRHMVAEAEVAVEVRPRQPLRMRVDIEVIGSMSARLSVSQWSRWRRRKRELTVR